MNPTVTELLKHLMCQDIPTAQAKIGKWSFTTGIARHYARYGELTIKQLNAIARMIYNATGVECKHYKIDRSHLYNANVSQRRVATRERTVHNFHRLEPVNVHDLPYKEQEIVQAICHPFNNSSIVLEHHGRYFKVPKPDNYTVADTPTNIAFKFHKTECKGFMKDIH